MSADGTPPPVAPDPLPIASFRRDPISGQPLPPEALAAATNTPIPRATDLTGVLLLKHESLFLSSDAWGDVHIDSRGLGLYLGDTRVLSRYELRLNGERPVVLRTGAGAGYAGTIQLTNPDVARPSATLDRPDLGESLLPRHSLGVVRERLISGGLQERIHVDNYTQRAEHCALTLRVDADFADIFEVRGHVREMRGDRLPTLASDGQLRVLLAYRGRDGLIRRTHVAFSEPVFVSLPEGDRGPADVAVDWLIPAGTRHTLRVTVWAETLDAARALATRDTVPDDPAPLVREDEPAAAHRAWKAGMTAVTTFDPFVDRAVGRALADLRLLRNDGPGPSERYIAAGVPWFSTLFGRDAIVTALQLLSVRPQVAAETLALLARYQATERDDRRDAEPGKILHELRTGELAAAGEIPHSPYYGSIDATPLWLMLLGEYERWTADTTLVDRLWPNALAALHWLERDADPDEDGFVEFRTRSPRGLVNQGWKDSADANRRRDGTLAPAPLALSEVQAYVYAARLAVAHLARRRGEVALAAAQEAEAAALRDRFEAAFWMEEVGTYALALDRDKRQVDGVGSNPGHALWCGIVAPERAARVAESLTGPGLWSGWGIRTLSDTTGGFNPIGYHTGTVWPHDNAIAAHGLARYGLHDATAKIAATLLEATRYFRDARLPELFCGFERETSPYPVPYPVACSPQAWAAGALYQLLEAMLGMRADAAAGQLELVSPSLPAWLPHVELHNLRVGEAVVDLRFRREEHSTGVDVLRRLGDLRVVVQI